MSIFVTTIAELSQNFFNSDPLTFNKYFAITPDYQKYCLRANLLTRSTLTLAKEAMLIHDMAIHLLAGACKLTIGGVKGICAIASGIFGLETDHQTPSKQAAIHFGFACVYAADIFASITNINNTYPQHLIDKIETFFTDFLKESNKNFVTKNIIVSDPKIEQELKIAREELEKRDADLNQLEEVLEKTAQNLNEPSRCEKIVDKILNPNKSILEKTRSITKKNKQLEEKIENTLKKTETKEKEPIHKKDSSSLSNNQLRYKSSQFRLIDTESDDDIDTESDTDLLIQNENVDFWFDNEFPENDPCEKTTILAQKQLLKEGGKPIERFLPKNQAASKKVSKNPKQTSGLALRLAYGNKIRNRKKILAS